MGENVCEPTFNFLGLCLLALTTKLNNMYICQNKLTIHALKNTEMAKTITLKFNKVSISVQPLASI